MRTSRIVGPVLPIVRLPLAAGRSYPERESNPHPVVRSHMFCPLYYQGLKLPERQLQERYCSLARTIFFVSFRGTPKAIRLLYGVASKTRLAKPILGFRTSLLCFQLHYLPIIERPKKDSNLRMQV